MELTADDQSKIRDLYYRYAWSFDAGQEAEFCSIFTENATMEIGGSEVKGQAGLAEFVTSRAQRLRESQSSLTHLITNVLIEPKDDGVDGRAHFFVYRIDPEGNVRLRALGVYIDTIEQENGTWKIASRSVNNELPEPIRDAPIAFAEA